MRLYRARLSGPLLDRIDVHVRLPPVSVQALRRQAPGEGSAVVRRRVSVARAVQLERQGRLNALLSAQDEARFARLDGAGERLLGAAIDRLGLSARAHAKVVRVARTIADLAGQDDIAAEHVAEAIAMRVLDRNHGDSRPRPGVDLSGGLGA